MRGSVCGILNRPARAASPLRRSSAPANVFGRCAGSGLLALGLALFHATVQPANAVEPPDSTISQASLSIETASRDARQLAAWVIERADNKGLPFMIIDKVTAEALAFDRQGALLGIAPVLLGVARGDDSPPGIGDRALSSITPEERITPAGRFVAAPGVNLKGKNIVWVDYDAAISLHAVITGKVSDRRLHRLTTATPADNRISYGCINLPAEFFETIVRPFFGVTISIVYILPETRSITDEFFTTPESAPGARSIQNAAP